MDVLLIEAVKEGCSLCQVRNTMPVGDLTDYLSRFGRDDLVYISFENAYSVGGVKKERIRRMRDKIEVM